ncbi:hypothetical protein N869_10905, partial [Cellulomonas bogoriensis 69B4 = DSM 16987]
RQAGVAAAVALVVGAGGGYAFGSAGGSEPPTAMGGEGGWMAAPFPQDATTLEAPRSSVALEVAQTSYPMWGVRMVFSGEGLGTGAGVGTVWALDAAAGFDEAVAVRVADALGVPGEPRLSDGTWTVGPDDGSGPVVVLQGDDLGTVNFYDPTQDPWVCELVSTGEPFRGEAEPAEGAGELYPMSACEERDLGPAPGAEEARDRVVSLLGDLGLDEADLDVDVEVGATEAWTYVTVHRLVGGERSGLTWSASLTGSGVHSLYGTAAPVVDLGEYDLISPAQAVERMNDPRFGAGSAAPFAMMRSADEPLSLESSPMPTAEPAPVPERPRPTAPAPGSSIGWPVQQVTLTAATLRATVHHQPDGAALLVPSYELTGADGSMWTVLAVADTHLDLVSP